MIIYPCFQLHFFDTRDKKYLRSSPTVGEIYGLTVLPDGRFVSVDVVGNNLLFFNYSSNGTVVVGKELNFGMEQNSLDSPPMKIRFIGYLPGKNGVEARIAMTDFGLLFVS